MKRIFLILLVIILQSTLFASTYQSFNEVPCLYKGRIRPLDVAAKLWLSDSYNDLSLKEKHLKRCQALDNSALSLLFCMHLSGSSFWNDSPLFYIYSKDVKDLLNLKATENYFSYNDLNSAINENPDSNLKFVKKTITYHYHKAYNEAVKFSNKKKLELKALATGLVVHWKDGKIIVLEYPKVAPWHQLTKDFEIAKVDLDPSYIRKHAAFFDELNRLNALLYSHARMTGPYPIENISYTKLYKELKKNQLPPTEIANRLQTHYPLEIRLQNAGKELKVLPGRWGDWYSLSALNLKNYDREKNRLVPIQNFTLYSDEAFKNIQTAYKNMLSNKEAEAKKNELAKSLITGYLSIEKQSQNIQAEGKNLYFPSQYKLKIESLYYKLPLIEIAILLYLVSALFFVFGFSLKKAKLKNYGTFFCSLGFLLNTLILIVRSFVLGRPPVSNMFETVIYVPFVAVLAGFILRKFSKNDTILFLSSIVSITLLILLKVTKLSESMENVQAVLDSQYWLIVHVLMIVGSYGVFALAGVLGQVYLIAFALNKEDTPFKQDIGKALLQALYIGVLLLIPGTILGGIWAMESWGRFWDWDPKESWAFISSCIYLSFIHLYRFNKIAYFGLAIGAVIGLLAISFTWYGVNYILATGLHTYGFGSGNNWYYYSFLIAEALFLLFVSILKITKKETHA